MSEIKTPTWQQTSNGTWTTTILVTPGYSVVEEPFTIDTPYGPEQGAFVRRKPVVIVESWLVPQSGEDEQR